MQTLSLSITPAQTAAWRKQIFQQLTERTKRELENFRHYEQAVEQVGTPGRALFPAAVHPANPEVRREEDGQMLRPPVHPPRVGSCPF